ncbi:uncharacterized protein LOC120631594 [Pararge aegeria]|uniref:Jg15972 protein n=1 Tax=Pararge aegeria aegeria TaxID=348720 RepID=A0A8S4R631_9NEOP|nr:uncharacterized protein LOC120631594 [Pararge aegeria]CAH2229690.1 jg15972 [Pararge aegeria aegeria]
MGRMELPVLDKCCFVLDLKTGCIVLGVVNSILTFVLAVILITFAVDLKDLPETKRDGVDEGGMFSILYISVIIFVTILFAKFVLDLLFVWAVYKEKSGIIKKYCIFWIVVLVLHIIGFLKSMSQMSAGHLISQILFLAENFYYIAIVRSFLKSINEDGVI